MRSTLWNWKSAVVSSVARAAIFFLTNLPAGVAAAIAAGETEFAYRLVAAGFYGALTERFARIRPARVGTIAALVVLPILAHLVEYGVHRWAGTALAGPAVLVSVGVSVVSTRFNLFAMRRGLLVGGREQLPLSTDRRRPGGLVATSFVSGRRAILAARRADLPG